MKIPRQLIEKKLSQLLGADVTFNRLDVSLAGTLEAEGMTVAGDGQPLARVRRITARISVAKALAGQIAIKSLLIEGPEIFLICRDAAFKIPRLPSKPGNVDGFEFEAQSIRVTGGRFDFQVPGPGPAYHISAEKIIGEVTQSDGKTAFEFSVDSIGRRDVPIEFGPIKLAGTIGGTSNWSHQPISLKLHFPHNLNLTLDAPTLADRRAKIDLQGPLDVAKLQSALPSQFVFPTALSQLKFNGPVETKICLDIDAATGIQIHEATIRAASISVPLSAFFPRHKP